MAFKVNYGLQRAERARAKEAKKEAKLREREAEKAARLADPNAPAAAPETEEADDAEPGHDEKAAPGA